jgi:hypothetical protein
MISNILSLKAHSEKTVTASIQLEYYFIKPYRSPMTMRLFGIGASGISFYQMLRPGNPGFAIRGEISPL